MATFLIAVLMVLGLVIYGMAPETRERLRRRALDAIGELIETARTRPECGPFDEALRARTRWALLTPALLALNVTIFALMVSGPGAVSDPETLIGWGGNFWLRTRNGEWWRLATSIFVHAGMFHLLISLIGLAQIGVVLERLVGPITVAIVFLAAGVLASLANLAAHPTATGAGASGAIFGLYGLLLASSVWTIRHRSAVTMPVAVVQRLVPAAVIFSLYSLVNDNLGSAGELTGLIAGIACGGILAKGVSDQKPAPRPLLQVAAAAVVLTVLSAVPLRGVTDVKPEIERTIATEDRTAGAYVKAAAQFKNGRLTADQLAQLIDRTIIPELQAADSRLRALEAVPSVHREVVATAEEYVRLRAESWRLRSDWLRKSGRVPPRGAEADQHRANNRTIGQAAATERNALEVLESVRDRVTRIATDGA